MCNDIVYTSISLTYSSLHCSYSDFSVLGQPAIYPINLDDTCISEEDSYTDDSSDSNEEDGESGSDSDDPTFILDTSQKVDADITQVSFQLML